MAKKDVERAVHCPYLETIGAESREPLSRPSHRHRCTVMSESRLVAPRTQVTFCLTEQHSECPFFTAEAWQRLRPPEDEALDLPDWIPS
jgi:hypothetical protein